jgi:hypothetical protein
VIDPHGTLADEVLACIPKWRTEDVVYFNPGDVEHPIAWDLMTVEDGRLKELVVSEMLGAFKSIWRDSWGPRLEYILEVAGCSGMYDHDHISVGLRNVWGGRADPPLPRRSSSGHCCCRCSTPFVPSAC